MRRTAVNCLLVVTLILAGLGFLSCRQERLIVQETPQMQVEKPFWVRALLAERVDKCTIKVRNGFSVLGPAGEILVPETVFTEIGQPVEIKASAAGLSIGGRSFATMEATILPDEPHIFTFDGNDFRGKLVMKVNTDYTTFDAVNVVPLESYLAGVVTAEMPAYWQIESLKAQAIAARTYCLYNKRKFQNIRHWDVTRTTASQVYNGLRAESVPGWRAVNDTWGQILVCDQNDGSEEIFPAYYSSTCGGHTEDAKNVFGDSYAPLTGAVCPYCKDVARPNTFFWPMVQFDKTEVETALKFKYPKLMALGKITSITPVRQSDYSDFSRLTMIKLQDSDGASDFLRAEDFRLTVDPSGSRLKSSSCKIISGDNTWVFLSGRGFGHGVGMCQCGAEGMARQGLTAGAILSYYYPGSKLVRVY